MAYVVCESAEEEKEAAFAAVGERGVLEIVDKIRWFLAVHSCVYYDHGKTVCSDSTWDRKARELAKLQDVFGADVGSWENETFDGFSGDTGYHLPRTGAVKREARSVIEQAEEEDDE